MIPATKYSRKSHGGYVVAVLLLKPSYGGYVSPGAVKIRLNLKPSQDAEIEL
jgi:hypothetical protein